MSHGWRANPDAIGWGGADEELPTAETIGAKLNLLGYYLKKVAKSQPQKNFPRPTPSLHK